jgi:hypothetical protein
MLRAGALAIFLGISLTSTAGAVSQSVRDACKTDYFAYCSAHPVESESLRGCMKAVGLRLSPRCLYALVSAGEVSKADIRRALLARPGG